METLYRKVQSSDRNPIIEGIYNTSKGLLAFSKTFGWVTVQNYTTPNPEYWLEEIPDPTAQLKADKEEMLEALKKVKSEKKELLMLLYDCKIVIDMTRKTHGFLGSSEQMYNEIESLIQKMKL